MKQTLNEELNRMKTLMEGVPRDQLTEVTVLYRGNDDKLEDILDHIRKIGNTGHSFEILIDPDGDKNDRKSFGWDGDGANYIKEIRVNGKLYTGKDQSDAHSLNPHPEDGDDGW